MNATSVRTWLAQEVVESLAAGPVGLYELLEILNNSDLDMADDEKQAVSREVVADLLKRNLASVCLLRWPRDDVIDGPLPLSVLDEPGSWSWLPSKLYLALVSPTVQRGGEPQSW